MIAAVGKVKPIGGHMWDDTAAVFNTDLHEVWLESGGLADSFPSPRDADALKRKCSEFVNAKKPTGTSTIPTWVRDAKRIK